MYIKRNCFAQGPMMLLIRPWAYRVLCRTKQVQYTHQHINLVQITFIFDDNVGVLSIYIHTYYNIGRIYVTCKTK